jgi:archaellum component FlaG (FlaF/FlaG flagellin family)
MPHFVHRASLLAALMVPLVPACKADIHDNTVTTNANLDFKIDSNVDLNDVKPGQAIAVTMNVTGAVLVDPNTTPPPNEVDTAAYFKIYIDDTGSDPILVTASTHVNVTIPASTPPGDHKLICRLHKHDGTPTDQEQEIDFKVSASASVSVTSPVDSGTP